jgi:ribosome-binding protein aMBF1 (putative translation factor)
MKSNVYKSKELIERRYGKPGSSSREKFRDEAFSYYFGEIIKSRRKELKMSQEELANLIGKKRPYISRVENGEDIRISNLMLIAHALDLNLEFHASEPKEKYE